jgi:hypothetical protein
MRTVGSTDMAQTPPLRGRIQILALPGSPGICLGSRMCPRSIWTFTFRSSPVSRGGVRGS